MVTLFYFFTLLASLIMVGSFLYKNKRIDTGYMLLSIMIFFNALGRWLVAASQTVEQGIWATKILYLGACFAPLMLVIVISRLSDIHIHRAVIIVLLTYTILVFLFVMTIGYSDIYYKSIKIAHGRGYNYLIKEYGPMHNLYTILMIIYIVMLIYIMIKAFMKRKTIAFETVLSTGMLGAAVIVTYLLTRLFNSSIEWLSVGYLIAIIILTRLFERINMYDMTTNISIFVAQTRENGFIVFDIKKKYVNSNDFMKQLFPEINSWQVKQVPPNLGSYFCDEVIRWFFENGTTTEKKTLRAGEKYFEFSVRDITYGKKAKKIGFLLEAFDRTAEYNYRNVIQKYNSDLAAEVAAKTEHINHIKDMMVLGMASMVESRDNSTGGHIRRTRTVVSVFSKSLKEYCMERNLPEDFLDKVIRAASMHDIGKIAVDDAILRKNGKFTDEEYSKMKCHSAEGARIIKGILTGIEEDEFEIIAENIAHYHHEKWDGSGYPDGLSGENIPVEARIMALADVFDALVSKRCYKEAFGYDRAFSIIEESLGSHFDPELGKIFLDCRLELEKIYDELNASEA